MEPKIDDQASLGINLKWLIQIIVVAALAVWGYFGLTSQISQLQIDVMRMKDAVEMNSEFRVRIHQLSFPTTTPNTLKI